MRKLPVLICEECNTGIYLKRLSNMNHRRTYICVHCKNRFFTVEVRTDRVDEPEAPTPERLSAFHTWSPGREYQLDLGAMVATYKGVAVNITQREWQVIRMLVHNYNRPLSTAFIEREVWDNHWGNLGSNLRVVVNRIRNKLPQSIEAVPWYGYRWAWRVEKRTVESEQTAEPPSAT